MVSDMENLVDDIIFEYKNITKKFFGVPAVTDTSFQLKKGQILGLIGENGAGKSTLMNIMGGVLQPDDGTLLLRNEVFRPKTPKEALEAGIGFIHQELNLFSNLNIAENMYVDRFPYLKGLPIINKKELNREAGIILDKLGIDFNVSTLVENLSPGEKQLVEIAKALSRDADIVIFDEPTTSLTSKETEKLFLIIDRLKEEGKSIIYISHILEDVIALTDDLVILRDGQVVESGPTRNYLIDEMISFMVGSDLNKMYPDKQNEIKEKILLSVEDITQPGMVKNISFKVRVGEVVGIFGLMGSGRTELARMIFGLDPYSYGKVEVEGKNLKKISPKNSIKHGISFITEDRRNEGLLMDVSIVENIGLVSLPKFTSRVLKFIDSKRLHKKVAEISELLKIKTADIKRQLVKSLSGGNQQKVVIGKWFLNNPRIVIMDEPTRGIDVGAKYEIYTIIDKLAAEGSGILVISSEVEELLGICDSIIVMSRGEIVNSFSRKEFNQEKIIRAAFKQDMVNNNIALEGE